VVSGTLVPDARRTTALPSRCSHFFSGEKCSIESVAEVLVVGVGVDDHVGAELQGCVEPGLEAGGEALVVGQRDDVVDAVRARHLDGRVGRAVVDDQPLDLVDPLDLAREVGERRRQLLGLVVAWDLDDQLHLGGGG
jgi:hypothetical protein